MGERTAGSRPDLDDQQEQEDQHGHAGLAELLRGDDGGIPDADRLVRLTAHVLPAAERVGLLVVGDDGRWISAAATDAVAAELDSGQVDGAAGPARDVLAGPDVVVIDDLQRDPRWPTFAERALARGVRAVLCARTPLEGLGRAVLSCYATQPATFAASQRQLAAILGAYAAAALAARNERERAVNLTQALESNRLIGMAIGIVMMRELLTPEQAFDRLRMVSQRRQRKLRDVADEVVRTGEFRP